MNEKRMWGKTGLKPPPDKPVCGFFNELCPDDNSGMYLHTVGLKRNNNGLGAMHRKEIITTN